MADFNYDLTYHSEFVGHDEYIIPLRYTLVRVIGGNYNNYVLKVIEPSTNRYYAIKRLRFTNYDLITVKRIVREMEILLHLRKRGNNIIQLVDMYIPYDKSDFSDVYLVAELNGGSLHGIMRSKQELTNVHAQAFVYQILRGLKYIHSAGILHRDLTPRHILTNRDCEIAIGDFSTARGINVRSSTSSGNSNSNIGNTSSSTTNDNYPLNLDNNGLTFDTVTLTYRAPELLFESTNYGPEIDVWSVGCILYEILNKKHHKLFNGHGPIDQLKKIAAILGPFRKEDFKNCNPLIIDLVLKIIRNDIPDNPIPWEDLVPEENYLGHDLLKKLLCLNPEHRITVDDALNHPYFDMIRNHVRPHLLRNGVPLLPVCNNIYDFSFERENPSLISKDILQHRMRELLYSLHPTLRTEDALILPDPFRSLTLRLMPSRLGNPIFRFVPRRGTEPPYHNPNYQAEVHDANRQLGLYHLGADPIPVATTATTTDSNAINNPSMNSSSNSSTTSSSNTNPRNTTLFTDNPLDNLEPVTTMIRRTVVSSITSSSFLSSLGLSSPSSSSSSSSSSWGSSSSSSSYISDASSSTAENLYGEMVELPIPDAYYMF